MPGPWTYSGDPSASAKDQVRFLTGQTSTGDAVLVYDREITWAIGQYGSVWYTAAAICETLAGTYGSGQAIKTKVGNLEIDYAQDRAQQLRAKAKDLRLQGSRGVVAYDGSAVEADGTADRADTTFIQPQFRIGQDDFYTNSTG